MLKNKEGNKFIIFLNIFFFIISIAVYISGGQYGWLKFNLIFVILSGILFVKNGEISANGLTIFYNYRLFKRRVEISSLKIRRITVSYHQSGKNYPCIGIVLKKPPFYVEFRFDEKEISQRCRLFEELEKLKECNSAIKIKFSPPKEYL